MRLTTHIDVSFRERADDPERLAEARREKRADLEELRASLAETSDELEVTRLGRVLNRLSEYAKLAGDDEQALEYGREALEIWRDLDRDRAAFLARLRCVEIQFFLGERDEALGGLDALVERTQSERFEVYRDFALVLRGRCRCAAGELEDGRSDLEQSLEIRRDRGNDRLIEHTRSILERADDRPI